MCRGLCQTLAPISFVLREDEGEIGRRMDEGDAAVAAAVCLCVWHHPFVSPAWQAVGPAAAAWKVSRHGPRCPKHPHSYRWSLASPQWPLLHLPSAVPVSPLSSQHVARRVSRVALLLLFHFWKVLVQFLVSRRCIRGLANYRVFVLQGFLTLIIQLALSRTTTH